MNILHVTPDSHLSQYLGQVFEEMLPGGNTFLLITNDSTLKYPIRGARNVIARPGLKAIGKVLPMALRADAIIAHGLTREAALLMALLRGPVKIWSGWGFDYYGDITDSDGDILAPLTSRYASEYKKSVRRSSLKQFLREANRFLNKQAIGSVDYFSAPIPSDLEVMSESCPEFNGAYMQLNYGDIDSMFSAGVESGTGINVLVGNSASMTNNHEDIFERLVDCDLGERRVVVPLSYGDADYRSYVIERGRYYFGGAFWPLIDFMPLNDYVRIISSCSVVVMGHRRQQALGNIGAAIFHGANVYLDEACPTYQFLKLRGVHVSGLLQLEKALPLDRVAIDVRDENRKALEAFWGVDVVKANVAHCLSRISNQRFA